MKIKVIRGYRGDEGEGPDKDVREGSEHTVSRTRGNQLKANGLVEILSDDNADSGEGETSEESKAMTGNDEGSAKVAAVPENKKAAAPSNKATASAPAKTAASQA